MPPAVPLPASGAGPWGTGKGTSQKRVGCQSLSLSAQGPPPPPPPPAIPSLPPVPNVGPEDMHRLSLHRRKISRVAESVLSQPGFRTSHCRVWKVDLSDKFFAVMCSRDGRRKYQVLVHSASQCGCHGEQHRDTAECSVCAAVSLSFCRSAIKVAHGISFSCCSGSPC